MRKFAWLLLGLVYANMAASQTNPLWLRYPSISPDGKQIVFSYKGDLYKVATSGGAAMPLTLHDAYDFMPVWSHDGKWIAFSSDRFGNFDVYVMPSEGGEPKRLTFNSAADYPYDFSPDDKNVIFGSGRNDIATSVRFPTNGVFRKLYTVPANGGRSVLITSVGMEYAHYNNNAGKIIYQDNKGFEDPWRKHHTSSITRDIWTFDTKSKEYKKITSFVGEDREPVFASDDQSFFYLNEKTGTLNVYKASLNGGEDKQLTSFKSNPVRFLSRSNNSTLCFTNNGEIYTMSEGSEPKKVNIVINTENKSNTEHVLPINGGATEFELSPNGKEIAFIFRGEVFVTSVDGGITKRITNTPYQERTVTFGPDGRTLYYAAERNGTGWDIVKSTISRKEEPYFYASTIINTEPVVATDKDEFQPEVSPNGKEIAYLEERNILRIYNLDKKSSRTIIPAGQNFSYADGDQSFTWSPDSKWIAARSARGNYGSSEIVLYKTDGTDVGTDVTASGFGNGGQQWVLNGKALLWTSDREGKRPLAYQGAREVDIYAMFFDKDLYDRFNLNKEDYALLKEKEDREKTDTTKKTDTALARKIKEPFKMDLADLDTRRIRLTNGSVNLSSFRMSPTGEKLFFTAKFEQGYDLWVIDPRTHELKTLAKLGAGNAAMEMSKDGKTLFVLSDGKFMKIDAESGRTTPVTINGEMLVNEVEERNYIFNHAWRQFKKKFYDPKIHGVDWDMYHDDYAKFLPHINNNYDFRELLSEMLGEVNASHTGGRYSPQPQNADATACLGLLYDESLGGNGLKITDIIGGGPIDKANSKIRAGQTIEKIDGESITANMDWAKLLNRKANRNVLLTVSDGKETFEEVVKPITAAEENALLYRRWTNKMRAMVNKLSNGKVGYVHVQAMNDASYRNVYDEVLGKNIDKDALIVDTRFNGGGWLHEDLSNFLSGHQYIKYEPYGYKPAGGGEPQGKWWKPSCLVMNEANYSDAHMFPYVYKTKGIGKLIGMPVPGTGTAVWWETQIDPTMVFGIPMIASVGLKEGRPLENLQLEPDIKVQNDYPNVLMGEDQQIEAAVKEMLKEIKEDK